MEEFLDLKKFIRHLAIENFLAEEDGLTGDYGPNNFYIYRFQNTTKFQFMPWDKSNTFWEEPDLLDIPQHRGRAGESAQPAGAARAAAMPSSASCIATRCSSAADSANAAAERDGRMPTLPTLGWLEAEDRMRISSRSASADGLDTVKIALER